METRVNGDTSVPLILSRNPDMKIPQVAAIDFPSTVLEALGGDRTRHVVPIVRHPEEARSIPMPVDIVEEWGLQSFPASDPPANW
jgi:hypothetical protein